MNVSVFCASSTQADDIYVKQAERLGQIMSESGVMCLYGGGRVGLMGALAKSVNANNGLINGIIPKFMVDEGWDNPDVTEILVDDMETRKKKLMTMADAIVVLPGGCGTLEELIDSITAKQLGIIDVPIVIVNVNGFYDCFISMMNHIADQKFMRNEHLKLWTVVSDVEEVFTAINNSCRITNARSIAAM